VLGLIVATRDAMRTSLIVTALLVVSGCVDNDSSPHHDKIGHDITTLIEVDTVEPPSLIVYRAEGSTTWQVPTRTSPGRFELNDDGPYRLTVVSDEVTTFVSVRQVARTDDDHAVTLPCDTLPSPIA
jgi:hypothetical protein